ncbi:hypothetical protein [Flammeovirga sp. OC4]|uniref:hypothetical protein n=1 Tax=Flammeovirga sp. OC4 TaxID=1382345 RepID=UPI0005C56C52|nr:hypothetical protein [Flammeovirga sp. OC4]
MFKSETIIFSKVISNHKVIEVLKSFFELEDNQIKHMDEIDSPITNVLLIYDTENYKSGDFLMHIELYFTGIDSFALQALIEFLVSHLNIEILYDDGSISFNSWLLMDKKKKRYKVMLDDDLDDLYILKKEILN